MEPLLNQIGMADPSQGFVSPDMFGTSQGLEALLKALNTGTPYASASVAADSSAFTGGRALIVESLENTMKILTYKQQMARMWQDIRKVQAFSTVEEYNIQTDYGAEQGAFITESDMGDLTSITPAENSLSSSIARKIAVVKFLGTQRTVTHPQMLVRTVVDPMTLETQAGTLWMIKAAEISIFEGNADHISSEFSGIRKQLVDSFGSSGAAAELANVVAARASEHIIDMRGEALSEEAIESGVAVCVQNYGMPTDLYLGLKAMSDLGKIMFPKERVNVPIPSGGVVGYAIKQFMSQHGLLNFKPNVFLDSAQPQRFKTTASAAIGQSAKIPYAPASGTTAAVSCSIPGGSAVTIRVAGDNSLAGHYDSAGANAQTVKLLGGQWDGFTGSGAAIATQTGVLHFYCVTASNRFGESAPTFLKAGTGTNTTYGQAGTGAVVLTASAGVQVGANNAGITADTGSGGVAWADGTTRINIYRATVRTNALGAGYAINQTTKFYRILSIPYVGLASGGYIDGDQSVSSALTTPVNCIYDLNETIPGTTHAYLVEHGEQTLQFKQLSPLMKMPLAQVTPAQRFALLLYGMPIAYAPRKMVIFRNVSGLTS